MATNLSAEQEANLVATWTELAKTEEMGLWWFAQDVIELVGETATNAEVRTIVLHLISPLIRSGMLAPASLEEHGYVLWTENADSQIRRIEEEWTKLDRLPRIGDVVEFVPRDAHYLRSSDGRKQ